MQQILVVGGAGYVGSTCCVRLLHRGFTPQILDNFSTGHPEAIPKGMTTHRLDYGDQKALAALLATERYDRGLTDFLNVLDAQRQQYEIEEEVIVAQQAAAIEFVIFYKSLGGGWERYEALPPIPEPEPAVLATFRRLLNEWR